MTHSLAFSQFNLCVRFSVAISVANQRIHATTGMIPHVRLEEEQAWLQPLPDPYITLKVSKPKVRLTYSEPINLQHPLSLYDTLLLEAHA